MSELTPKKVALSLIGILVVAAVSSLAYLLVFYAITLLDQIRGTSDSILQRLFVEIVSPGYGSFIGHLIVYKYFQEIDDSLVKGGFIGMVLFAFVVFVARDILDPASFDGYTLSEIVLSYSMYPSFIVGAIMAKR